MINDFSLSCILTCTVGMDEKQPLLVSHKHTTRVEPSCTSPSQLASGSQAEHKAEYCVPPRPKIHVSFTVLSCLICFWPTGIISLAFAYQVSLSGTFCIIKWHISINRYYIYNQLFTHRYYDACPAAA